MTPVEQGFRPRVRFALERWVQRGVVQQLVLMAGLVAVVAALGGVVAWALTPGFQSLPAAVWWSFLRLTDPGYLGDDNGAVLRLISTVVTVLGYVLFMGSMIAIMTQWLASTIRKLESGLTPIAMRDHFVILGWTNRTPEIIQKLLSAAGRMERFLAARGSARRLRVVVLAEEVDARRRIELRESLGGDWRENQIFLRSGSSLHSEHLQRLDLRRAAVVIVPGADFEAGGAELTDTRVVKTLLNLDEILRGSEPGTRPAIVAELLDPRKAPLAQEALEEPIEVVAGERLVGHLLAQSLRHPGVAKVLLLLLTHREGSALYFRKLPELTGARLRDVALAFPRAIVLGAVSAASGQDALHLDPTLDVTLADGDRVIFLAEGYEHCQPSEVDSKPLPPLTRSMPVDAEPKLRRLLILGWSTKIPGLLVELLDSRSGRFDITILSKIASSRRKRALGGVELGERLTIHNIEGDYSHEVELSRIEPHTFDHVVFLASSRMRTSEEADARTVLGLLLLRSQLSRHELQPEVLVELLDPHNESLLGGSSEVVFVSPRMLSHLLAHVSLVPELNAVFDSLIRSGGSEIELRSLDDLGLGAGPVTFREVQAAAATYGCVGLGFYGSLGAGLPHQVHLNPDRDEPRTLGTDGRVILLSAT